MSEYKKNTLNSCLSSEIIKSPGPQGVNLSAFFFLSNIPCWTCIPLVTFAFDVPVSYNCVSVYRWPAAYHTSV